jgi:hypothetical protein
MRFNHFHAFASGDIPDSHFAICASGDNATKISMAAAKTVNGVGMTGKRTNKGFRKNVLHFGCANCADIFGFLRKGMEFWSWVFEEFQALGTSGSAEVGGPARNHLDRGSGHERPGADRV